MRIGYAFCGSFCTHGRCIEAMKTVKEHFAASKIVPILSENAANTDTKFGRAADFRNKIINAADNSLVLTIPEAETLGPTNPLDLLIISPCTGNTLAKLANGITDTTVTMAAKAHLRCDRPCLIALATNDAMSANLKNIAALLSRKNIYFVPMLQDMPTEKPHSLVADFSKAEIAAEYALGMRQMRPLFL